MKTALRSWTIRFVAPTRFLTSNDRLPDVAKNADIRHWRTAVKAACAQARLPKAITSKIRVDMAFHFRGRAPVREISNLSNTSKACVDGLTPQRHETTKKGPRVYIGYGLIPDDARRFVDGPHLHWGDPLPPKPGGPVGEVAITITEIEPTEEHA